MVKTTGNVDKLDSLRHLNQDWGVEDASLRSKNEILVENVLFDDSATFKVNFPSVHLNETTRFECTSLFICVPKLVSTTVHPACDILIAYSVCKLSLLGIKGVTFCQESSYTLYFQISLCADKIITLSRPAMAILQLYKVNRIIMTIIIITKRDPICGITRTLTL